MNIKVPHEVKKKTTCISHEDFPNDVKWTRFSVCICVILKQSIFYG